MAARTHSLTLGALTEPEASATGIAATGRTHTSPHAACGHSRRTGHSHASCSSFNPTHRGSDNFPHAACGHSRRTGPSPRIMSILPSYASGFRQLPAPRVRPFAANGPFARIMFILPSYASGFRQFPACGHSRQTGHSHASCQSFHPTHRGSDNFPHTACGGTETKNFDRMNKIIKMNKIVLHPNLVNRANHVNPVQSSFRPPVPNPRDRPGSG